MPFPEIRPGEMKVLALVRKGEGGKEGEKERRQREREKERERERKHLCNCKVFISWSYFISGNHRHFVCVKGFTIEFSPFKYNLGLTLF